MAERRNYRAYYQDGSAARNLYTASPVPEEFYETDTPVKQERRREPVKKKAAVATVSPRSKRLITFWICMGVAAVVAIASLYLGSRGSLAEKNAQINKLQAELTELTLQNEALEASVNDEIDYDAIRKTAMEDYGMITPGDGQIRTYSTQDEGYVRQYKDVR